MCAKYCRNWSTFIETIVKWKRWQFFGPQCRCCQYGLSVTNKRTCHVYYV